MSTSHPLKFGAWLMIFGIALPGADGGAFANPDTTIEAAGSGTTMRPPKAAMPGKPSGEAARPVKSARSGKPGKVAPGKMQVAEPKVADGVPGDGDSKAWQRSHAKGLTQEQKRAFRERKEKMQEMMGLIKEKRMAIRDAEPEKRAALARELHKLILEEDGPGQDASSAAARTGSEPRETEAAAEKGEAGVPRRKQAEFRQMQMEKRKEEMRKEEIRKQQMERLRKLQESKGGSDREGRKND